MHNAVMLKPTRKTEHKHNICNVYLCACELRKPSYQGTSPGGQGRERVRASATPQRDSSVRLPVTHARLWFARGVIWLLLVFFLLPCGSAGSQTKRQQTSAMRRMTKLGLECYKSHIPRCVPCNRHDRNGRNWVVRK